MLDLNHPRTEYVFAASRLEDAVRDVAERIIAAQPSERPKLLAEAERSIDAMRSLNLERFGGTASIASAIDNLQIAIRALADGASPNWEAIGPAFTRLASNDGFGTVWI